MAYASSYYLLSTHIEFSQIFKTLQIQIEFGALKLFRNSKSHNSEQKMFGYNTCLNSKGIDSKIYFIKKATVGHCRSLQGHCRSPQDNCKSLQAPVGHCRSLQATVCHCRSLYATVGHCKSPQSNFTLWSQQVSKGNLILHPCFSLFK